MEPMIRFIEVFIGIRYLFSKRQTRFVSFISMISLIGISLGVSALIVILSVMNGFEGELRNRLLSMTAHGYVTEVEGKIKDWKPIYRTISDHDDILSASPYISIEGMIKHQNELNEVLINGVNPNFETMMSSLSINFIVGDLNVLKPDSNNIVLGKILAQKLNVYIGDNIFLLVPKPTNQGLLEPVLGKFVVQGIFEAGVKDHDSTLALIHLNKASQLVGMKDNVTGIRFLTNNVMAAPLIAKQIEKLLGKNYLAIDWGLQNKSYFRAIQLEKTMMSLILSLIIGVAAFNIVASLVMVVKDKNKDIAILRALGLEPRNIVSIFFIQGALIGWFGVVIGIFIGLIVAKNVPILVPLIEDFFRFRIMPGDVFYVTEIPSIIIFNDIIIIGIVGFLLTSLATIYPARKAARVNPAMILRYQ